MRKISLFALLLVFGQALAETPEAWFERMRSALQGLDYEGRFVYQVGDRLDAMYVVHRVSATSELERLVSLNGESRQVIRGSDAVACLLPGGNLASVLERGADPAPARPDVASLSHYRLVLGQMDRVAGRTAQILEVQPTDQFRFGYRLFLDADTGLPLRIQTVGSDGRSLAQMMFVELHTGDAVPPIEHDLSALSLTERPPTVSRFAAPAHDAGWHFKGLPAGYRLSGYRYEPEIQRRHFILSDGLATLSVYIEPIGDQPVEGHTRMGAINTFGMQAHEHQVIALGEVPVVALQAVAQALNPQ